MKNQFIELIKNFGEFNNWKGYVEQYFNTKNQRKLEKLGVYKDMKILDAYKVLTNYNITIMKQNIGELTEADLKARRRFWNKEGFFGEPTKKAIERSSMEMQKLVKAMQGHTAEEIRRINSKPYHLRSGLNDDDMIATASRADIEHAILTFKIL